MLTTTGGNSPQMLVSRISADIRAGHRNVVLIGGVECMYSRRRARRVDPAVTLAWSTPDDPPCPTVVGDDRPGTTQYEMAHRALAPTQVYPLFETALRHRRGHDIETHQQTIAALWSELAAVGATNPHAWSPVPYTPEEIRVPSADNRLACFPYTKRMCANLDVDQAAAIVLCSHEAATAAGVPADQMVFPLAGADAHDHYYFTERESLAESVAIGHVVRDALGAAGLGIDDVTRFDLYSCFPSAVQLAMDSIGLRGPAGGDHRALTVTGGLAYAGGPGNNYVTHSIAAMVDACRRDPGSIGLVTGLGWYVTKHSAGLYSSRPPRDGFRAVDPATTQAKVDQQPRREPAGLVDGTATVEATSIAFDHDGSPTIAIVSALLTDGRRALANSTDRDLMAAMVADAWEGRTVTLRTDGDTNTVSAA